MDLDIAIVGGGPSGVSTALFFAAAAPHLLDRIAIFEKERYPREKICAGAVGARADRLLERIGVRVDVPSAVVNGLSIKTAYGESATRIEVPIGRVVRRVEFDERLAEIARSKGVRITEGARVTDIAVDAAGVRLTTDAGEVRAKAVVGADGVGSFVRRSLGAPRGSLVAQVVETDTEESPSDRPRDLLHFDITDPSLLGYGWDFPTIVRGEEMVCRGFYHLKPEGDEAFGLSTPLADTDVGARLTQHLEKLGVKSGKVKRFAERGLSLHEPVARPRAMLVGEAAGIDPVLGEGIAQAIFYGAAAGPYLARCLDRGDLDFASFRREIFRSWIGVDLGARTRLTSFIYGRTRPMAEHWVVGSRDLAVAGLHYFAGERVPRREIAGAVLDLGRAAVEATLRRGPWW